MVTSSLLPAPIDLCSAEGAKPGRAGRCEAVRGVPPPASPPLPPAGGDFTFRRREGRGGAGAARALCASRASQLICGARTEHRGSAAPPARGERHGGVHRGDYGISAAQMAAGGCARQRGRERGWGRPGVPGEAAPGTRRGTTSAPPTGGEGGGAQVCVCLPSGRRPARLRPWKLLNTFPG